MIILGIDPGLATAGFGVIEKAGDNNKALDYGVISTPKDLSLTERLKIIEDNFVSLIEKFKPTDIAVEELFFAKNVKTALNVAHARGVILLCANKYCQNVFEYTPLQIKQGLTGYGRADKNQIQQMVKILLNLKTIPSPDDAADALAVALCHSQTNKFTDLFKV